MRRASSLMLLAVTWGCMSGAPTAPGPVDVQLVLAPGQIAQIDGTSLRLRFTGVTGDSRCPADALCILGGDALVRIQVIASSGQEWPYDLHTGSMQPVRHMDLTIALVQLTPYPFSSRTIAPDEYRATLRVTR